MVINAMREANLRRGITAFCCAIITVFSFILFWPQQDQSSTSLLKIKTGVTLYKLAEQMKEEKLISNKTTFTWAVLLLGKSRDIPAGNFNLKNITNNYNIIEKLIYGSPELKKITFLEGWNTNQFTNHIAEILGYDRNQILSTANDNSFLKKHDINYEYIEGYLFPDTYLISNGMTPKNVLNILVEQGKKFWTKTHVERAKSLGLGKHQIITLASIIEGEAIYDIERPTISAVYHNRLKIDMKLQADPTIQYIISDGPRRLLNRDLKIDSPYNTYLYKGLPPGPINSPGERSLHAALYPAKNEYLYFVAKGDGYHAFTKTEKGHLREKKKLQKIRRALRRNKNK